MSYKFFCVFVVLILIISTKICADTLSLEGFDEKIDVTQILKTLRDKKIVYDIDSYRKLGRNQFRISMFENISYENLEKLTKLISFIIER